MSEINQNSDNLDSMFKEYMNSLPGKKHSEFEKESIVTNIINSSPLPKKNQANVHFSSIKDKLRDIFIIPGTRRSTYLKPVFISAFLVFISASIILFVNLQNHDKKIEISDHKINPSSKDKTNPQLITTWQNQESTSKINEEIITSQKADFLQLRISQRGFTDTGNTFFETNSELNTKLFNIASSVFTENGINCKIQNNRLTTDWFNIGEVSNQYGSARINISSVNGDNPGFQFVVEYKKSAERMDNIADGIDIGLLLRTIKQKYYNN